MLTDTYYRQETAASVSYLVEQLCAGSQVPEALSVLDLCTGTGCIPLLFANDLTRKTRNLNQLEVLGVDISATAVRLAQSNHGRFKEQANTNRLEFNTAPITRPPGAKADFQRDKQKISIQVRFVRGNILQAESTAKANVPSLAHVLQDVGRTRWDILISNPPYISPAAFNKDTARSVRNFEPKLALVPPGLPDGSDEEQGDLFYPRLLAIADDVQARIVLVEVADLAQAVRVAKYAGQTGSWDGIEVWRDDPSATSTETIEGFRIRGSGNGRSVFLWRREAACWLPLSLTKCSQQNGPTYFLK